MLKYFKCLLILLLIMVIASPALARRTKTKTTNTNPRVQNLSGEDLEMFKALTPKQQQDIKEGKIKEGYNAWMVKMALGNPYYNTEHHPVYTDYEQVWLYTKTEEDKRVTEGEVVDPVTNWPSIHRSVWIKTCQIGDRFVMFDRGVVEKITKDRSKKTYGSCKITTHEEYIPIVDKKNKNWRQRAK